MAWKAKCLANEDGKSKSEQISWSFTSIRLIVIGGQHRKLAIEQLIDEGKLAIDLLSRR